MGSMDAFGWVEIIFVGVVALGLGFWQLWSINREIKRDKDAKLIKEINLSEAEN